MQRAAMGVEARDAKGGMTWMTLLAYGIIYFVWGSTFLAIRVGVHEVPPLLFAAMRFLIAGGLLLGWMAYRGDEWPNRSQWLGALAMAFLIFVMDYGLLFWAEQRVPSGIAAVMMATIPAFMALAEILILRTERLTVRLGLALAVGIAGVAALTLHSLSALNLGAASIDEKGAWALLLASLSWSVASVLTRKLPLPRSKGMSSAAQMLVGGALLAVAAVGFGEVREFHPMEVTRAAWIALAYLIVFGSIVGFTAYVWLIHHQSPTKVGTYAYVNPVVAVVIGYFFGGEQVGPRTMVGTLCILISVVMITTSKGQKRAAASVPSDTAGEVG